MSCWGKEGPALSRSHVPSLEEEEQHPAAACSVGGVGFGAGLVSQEPQRVIR